MLFMKLFFLLVFFLICNSPSLKAQDSVNAIRLDQEGFYPNAAKTAIVVKASGQNSINLPAQTLFYIIREENGRDTVFRGRLSLPLQSTNSSLQTSVADFSELTKTGTFRISISGCCLSYAFHIQKNVHHPAAVASLKAFYYQRASTELKPAFAGKWSRASGHPDDSVIIHPSAASSGRKSGSVIPTPGGWYDAGDYNKYIVNSGITMGTLLSAYENFKPYFDTLHTNIPASGRYMPDLLNEILYNLRWMLSMQDPQDGGVYNKCTNANFDPMVMPADARQPRYVVQKGTAATLDLAAVAAQASRIFAFYKNEVPGLSDSCLHAAEKAWAWAQQHPDLVYDQNAMNQLYEPKIFTGGYGDRKFTDEWFWSASELFVATGKKMYEDTVTKYILGNYPLPSWSETGLLGYYCLLRTGNMGRGQKHIDSIQTRLIRMADNYIRSASTNAFLTVMGGRKSDFNWGSNANAANQGILMIQVYLITRDLKYLNAAMANLEYICGRNATGYCFITGIGSYSTKHPHHRPSVADGIADPIPGFLAGGPNPGEQDHCHYDFHEAETAYVDSDCAYASNEIAINWNAPLVYLSNALEVLQNNLTNQK